MRKQRDMINFCTKLYQTPTSMPMTSPTFVRYSTQGPRVKVCPSCGSSYDDTEGYCAHDGTLLVPVNRVGTSDSDLVGQRIFGDYILRRKLGEGGMGAVYLAENVAINQRIAVKVLHPESAASDETVQRFNREADAIARLSHPNTIRVFIFGKTPDPLIYLAMEFVDGTSLREELHERGPFDELRTINILRQTLHALHEAHELGIVHRDMKPDNIMLTRFRGVDDFVKVLDFGIAKVKEQDGQDQRKLTQAGIVYGTPEYLSPEQARGKEIDHRADLYAIGIILYEMLTGSVPFTGQTSLAILSGHVYQEPPAPNSIAKTPIAEAMQQVMAKAIAKDPKDRYQSAMDFLEALEKREADILGGKSFGTTMLDVRQTGLVYEAARAAQLAMKQGGTPTEPITKQPQPVTFQDTSVVTSIDSPAQTKQVQTQRELIARQRKIIQGLGAAFAAMTVLALFAILTGG